MRCSMIRRRSCERPRSRGSGSKLNLGQFSDSLENRPTRVRAFRGTYEA
jgi:hypothetical protein